MYGTLLPLLVAILVVGCSSSNSTYSSQGCKGCDPVDSASVCPAVYEIDPMNDPSGSLKYDPSRLCGIDTPATALRVDFMTASSCTGNVYLQLVVKNKPSRGPVSETAVISFLEPLDVNLRVPRCDCVRPGTVAILEYELIGDLSSCDGPVRLLANVYYDLNGCTYTSE